MYEYKIKEVVKEVIKKRKKEQKIRRKRVVMLILINFSKI